MLTARQAKVEQNHVQPLIPQASVDARDAVRDARMFRPHPRPAQDAHRELVRPPDVGPRGVLAKDAVPAAVRQAGAGAGGSGPGANLRSLFGVEMPPSDTWMRERLEEVDPRDLRRCFRQIHAALQRGRVPECQC